MFDVYIIIFLRGDFMKIYFIYHSCFVVETKSSFLMFDYYKNKKDKSSDFDFVVLMNNIFESEKPLYVFSSHSHHDHFNKEILKWHEMKKNIHYILSYDIKIKNPEMNYYFMKTNTELHINNLKILSYGSTDEGISFTVEVDHRRIFHAGDLNWWKWSEDTLSEEKAMEEAFKNIVDDIKGKRNVISVAFFPVDYRLEENYDCGGEYFIRKIKPRTFIPMHFWDEFDISHKFKITHQEKFPSTKIVEIRHPNQLLEL